MCLIPEKFKRQVIAFAYLPRIEFATSKYDDSRYADAGILSISDNNVFLSKFFSLERCYKEKHSFYTYAPIIKFDDSYKQWGILLIPLWERPSSSAHRYSIAIPVFYEKGLDNILHPIMLVSFRKISAEMDRTGKFTSIITTINTAIKKEFEFNLMGYNADHYVYGYVVNPDDINSIYENGIGMMYVIKQYTDVKQDIYLGKGSDIIEAFIYYYYLDVGEDAAYYLVNHTVNKFIALKYKSFNIDGILRETRRYRLINTVHYTPTIGTNIHFNISLRTDQDDNYNKIYDNNIPKDLLFFNKLRYVSHEISFSKSYTTDGKEDPIGFYIVTDLILNVMALSLELTQSKRIDYNKEGFFPFFKHLPIRFLFSTIADSFYKRFLQKFEVHKHRFAHIKGGKLYSFDYQSLTINSDTTPPTLRFSFKLYWQFNKKAEQYKDEIYKIIKSAVEETKFDGVSLWYNQLILSK